MKRKKCKEIKVVRQLVPAELKLEQILEANPPKFKCVPDFLTHLIHLTVEIPARNKDLLREDGFVPFSSTILEVLNRRYRAHLDYLVMHNILEECPHYSTTEHYCKSFRLPDSLYNEGMRWAELTDEKLIDKLSEDYEVKPSIEKKYSHLAKFYFDEGFTIDEEAAVEYSYATYLKDKEAGVRNALNRHLTREYKIDTFKSGQRWFKCEGNDHRLHTCITNMDKGLRNFLSYKGQRIIAIDVKNSQPFLSIMVLRSIYPNLSFILLNTPTYTITNNHLLYIPMLVNSSETQASIDVYRFIQMVVNGDLYPFLIQEFEKEYGQNHFGTGLNYDEKKSLLKDLLFGIMYADSDSPMKGKKLFKKLFPGVLQAFIWFKAGDNTRLPIFLQQLEAKLILDRTCGKLAKEHPDVPLWPVHDCIATTEGNEQVVTDAIKEVFKEAIGFEPTLKPEYWCKDCEGLKQAA